MATERCSGRKHWPMTGATRCGRAWKGKHNSPSSELTLPWNMGDVSDLSPPQSIQLQIVLPCNRTQWVACHFPGHVMPWQSKLLIPSHGTAPLTWELGTLDAWVLSHGLCFTLGNMCNLAHFSDRLSLCLPCPRGEIWLHLGNKLENWAIIEWIRSMWAVSLSSVGQKPSE